MSTKGRAVSQVSVRGRLVADPGSPRTTPRGQPVLDLRLAVHDLGRREPVFVDVTLRAAAAASATRFLRSGSLVAVSGELVEDTWVDGSTGLSRSKQFVEADRVDVLDRVPAQAPPSPERPDSEAQ